MNVFLSDFEDKVQEIDKYFEFVKFLEIYETEKGRALRADSRSFSLDINLSKVLKANCYMMLYNLIEGSVTEAIDAIFEQISTERVYFKDLIPEYRRIWLFYQHGLINISSHTAKLNDPSKNRINKSITDVLDDLEAFHILTYTDKDGNTFNNYKGYLKVTDSSDVSGNLDAKKIRENLSLKYAFSATSSCDELRAIKDIRNKLAHGEIVFSEAGEGKSIDDIMTIKTKVVGYLQDILNDIDDLILQKRYKI